MSSNLVIVRAGRGSCHGIWTSGSGNRDFDVYLSPYQPVSIAPGTDIQVGELLTAPQFTSLYQLLTSWKGWRAYRYVTLANDDIVLIQDQWNAFFAACERLNVRLAQPALTAHSHLTYPTLVANSSFTARRVGFVETMAATFRGDVLASLLDTFALSETGQGWGIDFLWAKRLNYEGLFVIDAVQMHHSRPTGRHSFTMEQRLMSEANAFIETYNCAPVLKTFGGRVGDIEIPADDPAFLPLYDAGFAALYRQDPACRVRVLAEQGGLALLGETGPASIV